MNKRVFWFGVASWAVALAFVVTDELVPSPPGITWRNVRRIRPGMTLAEVEAFLGEYTGSIAIPEIGGKKMLITDREGFLAFFRDPECRKLLFREEAWLARPEVQGTAYCFWHENLHPSR